MMAAVADGLLTVGGGIGLYTKARALVDGSTTWTRRSSIVNLISWPFTALLPMIMLELWFSTAMAAANMATWVGIYLYRAPENEDWRGRSV